MRGGGEALLFDAQDTGEIATEQRGHIQQRVRIQTQARQNAALDHSSGIRQDADVPLLFEPQFTRLTVEAAKP